MAPRLEISLAAIEHNARILVERLAWRHITVTGVTKATLGSPEVARAMLRGGVAGLGDSRIENIEALRHGGITAPLTLIRSPMLSQVDLVVQHATSSLNSEIDVVAALSSAARAQHRTHGVVVMVELGDLREGVLPGDVATVIRQILAMPHIALRGIGANLACQSGVAPNRANMAELSLLATSLEATCGTAIGVVSGGNSANLQWALGEPDSGRINNLRLGESILLGNDPLGDEPIDGLAIDAFSLVGEVIEAKHKPTRPWGEVQRTSFDTAPISEGHGLSGRAIVALGRQDVDPDGIRAPEGVTIVGASSDHLVIDTGASLLAVGSEVRFGLRYRGLLRAMTSPFVARVFVPASTPRDSRFSESGHYQRSLRVGREVARLSVRNHTETGRPIRPQPAAIPAETAAKATIPPRMSPAMPAPIRFIT